MTKPEPDALKALQEVTDASSMLTLAVSNAAPGTRLVALKDLLDGVQQKLSRVNAHLLMHPDLTLQPATGEAFTDADVHEIGELEMAIAYSMPEEIPGRLVCTLDDGRRSAATLRQALDGRPVLIKWDNSVRQGVVDLSDVIYPLLDVIDPNGDDAPGYWAGDENDDADAEEGALHCSVAECTFSTSSLLDLQAHYAEAIHDNTN